MNDQPTSGAPPSFLDLTPRQCLERGIILAASFASIGVLLGHLYGLGTMLSLTLCVWLPLALLMGAVWMRARRNNDEHLLAILRLGFWGGLWGTTGYDLFRIPFHAHYNLFGAIRFYGLWLTGADSSSALTDTVGIFYHYANGITFGWIYAVVALRRHWLWALLWGLALESLAVLTVFGEVFAIRQANTALTLAYAAHLAYGFPLGWICAAPERRRWGSPFAGWLALTATIFIVAWFNVAWQPQPPSDVPAGTILVHDNGLYPGAIEVRIGTTLQLRNSTEEPLSVAVRHATKRENAEVAHMEIGKGQAAQFTVEKPGLHQFTVPGKPFRSVIVLARKDRDYTDR